MFYYQRKALKKPCPYESERERIYSIYHEHKGRYGYRRIQVELRKEGIYLNHKTVQRLMSQLGLKSTVRPKKYRAYKGEIGEAAPNVLKRNFNADRSNEKWVTDVTEFKVNQDRVFLSPVIDLCTREVLAYRISKNATLPFVTAMLSDAIGQLDKSSKPIVHSDQGWHYRHKAYQKLLKDNGLTQSMSRRGNCLNNAVAENFFGILKTEMYYGQKFKDADELIMSIKEYIEYYNAKRIKLGLEGLTPIEYRNQFLQVA